MKFILGQVNYGEDAFKNNSHITQKANWLIISNYYDYIHYANLVVKKYCSFFPCQYFKLMWITQLENKKNSV